MGEPFHEANKRLRERKRIENDKDAEIERLQARVEALEGVVRDAHYEGYMAGVGDSEDYDHDPTVMEKDAWAEYEETE